LGRNFLVFLQILFFVFDFFTTFCRLPVLFSKAVCYWFGSMVVCSASSFFWFAVPAVGLQSSSIVSVFASTMQMVGGFDFLC
jgi:hypothetical protein